MFRRLLEASTRAASGQLDSILQATQTPDLHHNPGAILTGPAVASSSSSPGSIQSNPSIVHSHHLSNSTHYLSDNEDIEYSEY